MPRKAMPPPTCFVPSCPADFVGQAGKVAEVLLRKQSRPLHSTLLPPDVRFQALQPQRPGINPLRQLLTQGGSLFTVAGHFSGGCEVRPVLSESFLRDQRLDGLFDFRRPKFRIPLGPFSQQCENFNGGNMIRMPGAEPAGRALQIGLHPTRDDLGMGENREESPVSESGASGFQPSSEWQSKSMTEDVDLSLPQAARAFSRDASSGWSDSSRAN